VLGVRSQASGVMSGRSLPQSVAVLASVCRLREPTVDPRADLTCAGTEHHARLWTAPFARRRQTGHVGACRRRAGREITPYRGRCSPASAFLLLPPALLLTCTKQIFAKSPLPPGKDPKRMIVARTRGLCLHSAPRCRSISAEEPLLRLCRLRRLDIQRHLVRRSPPAASVRPAHSTVPRNRGLDLIPGRPVHVS